MKFIETSAKSGDNVDKAFKEMAEEIMKKYNNNLNSVSNRKSIILNKEKTKDLTYSNSYWSYC